MASLRHVLRATRFRAFALAAAGALVLAACGNDAEPGAVSDGADAPQHIHGLGVDPSDGSLFIATHTGLWRAAAGSDRARRVGDSRQDVMGFTVVGPRRFLGSGHPDLRQDLPPLLGLIRSTDAGRSWTSVSLLGQADFHVLRYRAGRTYGFDSSNGRLLTSADDGQSWRQLSPPGPLVDLAVDPRDVDRVVAATEDGLHRSTDGGNTWRRLGDEVGLLAWPRPDALYLVDGEGRVHRSTDDGRSFDEVGHAGGQPAAFSHHRDELLLALHDSTVKRSTDAGRSWTVRARP